MRTTQTVKIVTYYVTVFKDLHCNVKYFTIICALPWVINETANKK